MKTALVVFFFVVENSTSFYIHKSSIIPLLSAVEPYFDLIKANTTRSRAAKRFLIIYFLLIFLHVGLNHSQKCFPRLLSKYPQKINSKKKNHNSNGLNNSKSNVPLKQTLPTLVQTPEVICSLR